MPQSHRDDIRKRRTHEFIQGMHIRIKYITYHRAVHIPNKTQQDKLRFLFFIKFVYINPEMLYAFDMIYSSNCCAKAGAWDEAIHVSFVTRCHICIADIAI